MHVLRRRLSASALLLALLLLTGWSAAPGAAQQEMEDVEIEVVQVADGVYMLMGRGGNIGLSVGEDGPFLIDDQFAPLTDKIRAAVATVSDAEVRFVVNTHWHGDHTGGNENFGEAGALIVAHENVRKRMNPEEFREVMGSTEQAPDAALPVVTFSDRVNFYWNGQKIEVQHVGPSHTDGDSIIWFTGANVVHMGDNFFSGRYPYIDLDSGGSAAGMIAAGEAVLERADADTRIIPGHGPLSDIEDLRRYLDVLSTLRDRVADMMAQGMSLEEIQAAAPGAEWDAEWGAGFIDPERILAILYRDLDED